MDLFIVDDYPGDAAHGCDYLSRAAKSQIVVDTPAGPALRDERIVVTSREEDFEGRICIGEKTVRYLAHKFGLVDEWRVEIIAADNRALRAEIVYLSAGLAAEREKVTRMAEVEREQAPLTFVAVDGTHHASARGAVEATAVTLGLEPSMIQDAVRVGSPIPQSKELIPQ